MNWIKTSYMARLGAARGEQRANHRLSEADQGQFHYVYGPFADPVMWLEPGDVVEVETLDAFGGAVKTEADLPPGVERLVCDRTDSDAMRKVLGGLEFDCVYDVSAYRLEDVKLMTEIFEGREGVRHPELVGPQRQGHVQPVGDADEGRLDARS